VSIAYFPKQLHSSPLKWNTSLPKNMMDITESENLALSCPCCNRFKGSDLGSIDPETQQLTSLSVIIEDQVKVV
jgi:hypothetical protein